MPYIQGVDRNQITLFPESIDEYIAKDSPVRVIDAYADQLDLRTYDFSFAVCPTIDKPLYDPRLMIKLCLYGYLNHIRPSRRLEQETNRNIELIWLLEKTCP